MKRAALLFLAYVICLGLAAVAQGEEIVGEERQLPIETRGTLVVFETDGMRCVLYVNAGGMAGGAGSSQCLPINPNLPLPAPKGFRIIRVVKTQAER